MKNNSNVFRFAFATLLLLVVVGNFLLYRSASQSLVKEMVSANTAAIVVTEKYIEILMRAKELNHRVEEEKVLKLQISDLNKSIEKRREANNKSLDEAGLLLSTGVLRFNLILIILLIGFLLFTCREKTT